MNTIFSIFLILNDSKKQLRTRKSLQSSKVYDHFAGFQGHFTVYTYLPTFSIQFVFDLPVFFISIYLHLKKCIQFSAMR